MSLEQVLNRIEADLPAAIARLQELLRYPSISTDPAYAGDCRDAADWLSRDLQTLGAEAAVRPTNREKSTKSPS